MRLDIILGLNIDTIKWIKKIESMNYNGVILVIDFEYNGKPWIENNAIYMSSIDGIRWSEKYKEKFYYKSLYAFPLTDGTMWSLYSK